MKVQKEKRWEEISKREEEFGPKWTVKYEQGEKKELKRDTFTPRRGKRTLLETRIVGFLGERVSWKANALIDV